VLVAVLGTLTFASTAGAMLPKEPKPSAPTGVVSAAERARDAEQFAEKERERRSPEARARREASRLAYRGLTRVEALELAKRKFRGLLLGEAFRAVGADPAGTKTARGKEPKVESYLDDKNSLVDTAPDAEAASSEAVGEPAEGGPLAAPEAPAPGADDAADNAIVSSSLPLRNDDDEPVDLALRSEGDGFAPKAPLVDVDVPDNVQDGIKLGGDDPIKITPVAVGPTDGVTVEDKLFYANIQSDTDLLVQPTPTGFETFHQLRSAAAPEDLSFTVGGPGELELREEAGSPAGPGRSVAIVRDGKTVGRISAPVAWDADEVEIPVTYKIAGNQLTLHVAHRERDVHYPLVVDPLVDGSMQAEWWWRDGNTDTYRWEFARSYSECSGWQGGWYYSIWLQAASGRTCGIDDWAYWRWRAPRNSYMYRAEFGYVSHEPRFDCVDQGIWGLQTGGWEGYRESCLTLSNNWWTACAHSSCSPDLGTPGNIMYLQDRIAGGTGTRVPGPGVSMGVAAIYLRDRDTPVWDVVPNGPSGWVKSGQHDVVAQLHDDGLGMRKYLMRVPGYNDMVRDINCSIWCPREFGWPNAAQGQPGLSYRYESMPEGVNTVNMWAYDALLKANGTSWQVKVDYSKPAVASLGGTLANLHGQTTEPGRYALTASATDGSGESGPSARSGVQSLDYWVRNEDTGQSRVIKHVDQSGQGCVNSCPLSDTLDYDSNSDGIGTFTFWVRATDKLGQASDSNSVTVKFTHRIENSTLQDGLAFGGYTSSAEDGASAASFMDRARALGADGIRVFADWKTMTEPGALQRNGAPQGVRDAYADALRNCSPPQGLDLRSPASYNIVQLDRQVNNATDRGMSAFITLDGPVPCWAVDPQWSDECMANLDAERYCKYAPDLTRYREWVHAVAVRAGPRAGRWSPWNEPNIASHLRPQPNDTSASPGQPPADPYIAGKTYRALWLAAKSEIDSIPGLSGAPFWFGDVTWSNQADGEDGTSVPTFLRAAACIAPACPAGAGVIDATELAFHDYLGSSLGDGVQSEPIDNYVHVRDTASLLSELQAASPQRVSANLKWLAETEFGVHYGAAGPPADPEPDRAGSNFGGNEDRQAEFLNCAEMTAWRRSNVTVVSQYLLQDATSDTWYTALMRRNDDPRGGEKPAYNAWRQALTVRRVGGRIEVWGAWRPTATRPPALQLVPYNANHQELRNSSGNPAFADITLGRRYFHFFIPASSVPAGTAYYRTVSGASTSRMAREGDCGRDWNGGTSVTP
jgi:hypothetical protein